MTATATSTVPATAHAGRPPRVDLYVHIHKALRAYLARVIGRVGRMDVDDDGERRQVVDAVLRLLAFMRSHLQHENDHVHTAIEARRPGAAREAADDHLLHLDALANLEDEARTVCDARPELRAALALRLYRHLAVFAGENLVHMQLEETTNNALLWELYDDDELMALHGRIVASLAPAELMECAYWFAAALAPQELAQLFGGMQRKAPPQAFQALLDAARPALDEAGWARLCRALGLPPVPGLMGA